MLALDGWIKQWPNTTYLLQQNGKAQVMTRTIFNFHLARENLQRGAMDDTVNGLATQPFHIGCVQEAFAESVQYPLFDSRGIEASVSRDRTIMINSGGGGWTMVRTCHDPNYELCDWMQRPAFYEESLLVFTISESWIKNGTKLTIYVQMALEWQQAEIRSICLPRESRLHR